MAELTEGQAIVLVNRILSAGSPERLPAMIASLQAADVLGNEPGYNELRRRILVEWDYVKANRLVYGDMYDIDDLTEEWCH